MRQRKLTSCSRGKPRLCTITSPNGKTGTTRQPLARARMAGSAVQGVGWYNAGKALLTAGTVLTGYRGDGLDESSCQPSVCCQIRLLVRQRKLTSCSPRLFTVTSYTAKISLRRDKDHDSHSRRGSGRGRYANWTNHRSAGVVT